MSASEKDLQILKHILEHCNRVLASTERFGKDYDSFSADCDYQDSVNLNLAQIGELAGKLSARMKPCKRSVYGVFHCLE